MTEQKMSGPLSEETKRLIAKALGERGATLPCPRCGASEFSILDGYHNQSLQPNLTGLVMGGPSVPTIGVACVKCGFVSEHALGVLGLLPGKETR